MKRPQNIENLTKVKVKAPKNSARALTIFVERDMTAHTDDGLTNENSRIVLSNDPVLNNTRCYQAKTLEEKTEHKLKC